MPVGLAAEEMKAEEGEHCWRGRGSTAPGRAAGAAVAAERPK